MTSEVPQIIDTAPGFERAKATQDVIAATGTLITAVPESMQRPSKFLDPNAEVQRIRDGLLVRDPNDPAPRAFAGETSVK